MLLCSQMEYNIHPGRQGNPTKLPPSLNPKLRPVPVWVRAANAYNAVAKPAQPACWSASPLPWLSTLSLESSWAPSNPGEGSSA